MKISVLLSIAIHPQSNKAIASPLDLKVCGMALALKQQGHDVQFLHFGENNDALNDYLGYGIAAIDCHQAPSTFQIADCAPLLQDSKLIMCGRKALSGEASGMLPYHLSQMLDKPLLANVVEVRADQQGLNLVQYLPSGYRKKQHLASDSSAVLTIHESAPSSLNYNYTNLNAGTINALDTPKIGAYQSAMSWQISPVKKLRKRFKIDNKLGGDERMKRTLQVGTSSGGQVHHISDQAAAQAIWDLLKNKNLTP